MNYLDTSTFLQQMPFLLLNKFAKSSKTNMIKQVISWKHSENLYLLKRFYYILRIHELFSQA